MSTPGLIPRVFSKIQEARRPDRFTQDFLETKLGFSGGSARAVIPLLKRMGFISSDGTPTKSYDQFRNSDTQGSAMGDALRAAYSELYERNEYAHDLTKEKLSGLITEITGASKDDTTTKCTVSTFLALKDFANFEDEQARGQTDTFRSPERVPASIRDETPGTQPPEASSEDVKLALSYTINLNLPESTNPDVFNAIFKALREHLLRK